MNEEKSTCKQNSLPHEYINYSLKEKAFKKKCICWANIKTLRRVPHLICSRVHYIVQVHLLSVCFASVLTC